MKQFFKAAAAAVLILLCLGACSNIPEEPATTGYASYTYKNAVGETVPVAENIGDYPGITQPVKFIETVHEIKFDLKSYYVYGNTVASIESITFDNIDTPQAEAYATVKAKMIGRGREKQMMIAFNAYDENGELLKKNGAMFTNLDGADDGDEFELLLAVPLGTARVEFFDYEK